MSKTSITIFTILAVSVVGAFIFRPSRGVDLSSHPVRRINFWSKFNYKKLPLSERIFETPDEIIDYLRQDNVNQRWPNKPVASNRFLASKVQLENVIKQLPQNVRILADDLLAGVFFVSDLGGSAYSEYIRDKDGKPVAGFVVIDDLILSKSANEWASWKEGSSFIKPHSFNLKLVIADENTGSNALEFIFLHELGHIVSLNANMYPPWDESVSVDRDPNLYRFSKISWIIENKSYVSLFDRFFSIRPNIQFYRGSLKGNPEAVYSALEKTNFPTLYSSTNPADDFADSFASFVHMVFMKKPYLVSVERNGQISKEYKPCWTQTRCSEKEKVLRDFLKLKP